MRVKALIRPMFEEEVWAKCAVTMGAVDAGLMECFGLGNYLEVMQVRLTSAGDGNGLLSDRSLVRAQMDHSTI